MIFDAIKQSPSVDDLITDNYANYFIQTLADSVHFTNAADRVAILSKISDFQRVCQDAKGTHVIQKFIAKVSS